MFGNRKPTIQFAVLYLFYANVFSLIALAVLVKEPSAISTAYLIVALVYDAIGRHILKRSFAETANIDPTYVFEEAALYWPSRDIGWVPWLVIGLIIATVLSSVTNKSFIDLLLRIGSSLHAMWLPCLSEQTLPEVAAKVPIYEVFRSALWLICGPVALMTAKAMSKDLATHPFIDSRLPQFEKGLICILLLAAFSYVLIFDYDVTSGPLRSSRGALALTSTLSAVQWFFAIAPIMTAGFIVLYGVGVANVLQCYLKTERKPSATLNSAP